MDAAAYDISVAKDLLRTMLATTTAFRTWDGESYSVDEAKARIYFDSLPLPAGDSDQYTIDELNNYRNCAIIEKPRDEGVRWSFAAAPNKFVCAGVLVVTFFRTIPVDERDDISSAERSMENWIGQLVKSNDSGSPGLVELSSQAGYLELQEIVETGPSHVTQEDINAVGWEQRHALLVRWGARL